MTSAGTKALTKGLFSHLQAQEYVKQNYIHEIFETLMTGLIFHQPENPYKYICESVQDMEKNGVNVSRWNLFKIIRSTTENFEPIEDEYDEALEKQFSMEHGQSTDGTGDADNQQEGGLFKKKDQEIILSAIEIEEINSMPTNLSYLIAPQTRIFVFLHGPFLRIQEFIDKIFYLYSNVCVLDMGEEIRNLIKTKIYENNNVKKWKFIEKLISDGKLAPNSVAAEALHQAITRNHGKVAIAICGFPRNKEQLNFFLKNINNFITAITVDISENLLRKKISEKPFYETFPCNNPSAIDQRFDDYKLHTLPVLQALEDLHKLVVIEYNTNESCLYDLLFDKFVSYLGPPHVLMKSSVFEEKTDDTETNAMKDIFEPVPRFRKLFLLTEDDGRRKWLPQCPLYLLMGGPGAGITTLGKKIAGKFKNSHFIDVNEIIRERVNNPLSFEAIKLRENYPHLPNSCLVYEHWTILINYLVCKINALPDPVDMILLSGFPKCDVDVDTFNVHIGGLTHAIFINWSLRDLYQNLLKRHESFDEKDIILRRIHDFKENGIHVGMHYVNSKKGTLIPGMHDQRRIFIETINAIKQNR